MLKTKLLDWWWKTKMNTMFGKELISDMMENEFNVWKSIDLFDDEKLRWIQCLKRNWLFGCVVLEVS